jgi:hypothetical protein
MCWSCKLFYVILRRKVMAMLSAIPSNARPSLFGSD